MNTGKYTCLEIFAKQTADGGKVRVIPKKRMYVSDFSDSGKNENIGCLACRQESTDTGCLRGMEKEAGKAYYAWMKFSLAPDTDYEILCDSCDVSLCYLSGNEDILETGVRYLEREKPDGQFAAAEQAAWYDRPMREAYHFAPWKNWMNDPNGLCWFQGYYHMFYQCNPHGQEWSNMYWGHAVSSDLIHWKHLPVVLAPQEEILEKPDEIKGGAFSGSAVVLEDEVVFYLTRHKGPLEDCEDTVEQQWMMRSRDMIHFTEETCVITHPPANASFDFRDPKVIKIGKKWYMVLGSAIEGQGAILLYESEDMEYWEYLHPLLIEKREQIRCFECPDFMELDGQYLTMGAWMQHYDDGGRYQMSRYYIGRMQEGKFERISDGWFDFGSNCYAMQSFEHEGRRISIGWISDFYNEHTAYENGAYGSLTIPRELHIRNGRLYMTPVQELEKIIGDELYQGSGKNVSIKQIEGNAYRAKIRFKRNISFTILLGKNNEKSISLINDKGGLRIVTQGVNSEGIRFRADVEEVRTLEIYMDRRVAEIYVNEGEAVGTKVFYNASKDGCFALCSDTPENVEQVRISKMKSIWS